MAVQCPSVTLKSMIVNKRISTSAIGPQRYCNLGLLVTKEDENDDENDDDVEADDHYHYQGSWRSKKHNK